MPVKNFHPLEQRPTDIRVQFHQSCVMLERSHVCKLHVTKFKLCVLRKVRNFFAFQYKQEIARFLGGIWDKYRECYFIIHQNITNRHQKPCYFLYLLAAFIKINLQQCICITVVKFLYWFDPSSDILHKSPQALRNHRK